MTTNLRADNALEAAKAIAPLLDERAQEGERLRTQPADVVDALRGAGVFKLALPRSLGGLECDPLTTVQVIEEISRANGSAGWTGMIGNTTAFVSWLDPAIAADILKPNPDMVMAGLLAPMGQAVPDGDGFRVTGRWPFNSGVPHAEYLCCGIIVMDNGAPRMKPDGPDVRFAYFPVSDATIHDTWDAAGLKGTGSHDVSVENILVPDERTADPINARAQHDGPLYRLTFWNVLMSLMAGFPLGVARRALDEFNMLAQKKSRSMQGQSLADDPAIEVEFAHAEAKVQAARALVFDAIGDAWETVSAGGTNSLEQRARLTMGTIHAVQAGKEAIDTVFHLAGGGALYDESPLQRCFRDIHAGGQHIALGLETWKRVGKALLGVEQPTQMV